MQIIARCSKVAIDYVEIFFERLTSHILLSASNSNILLAASSFAANDSRFFGSELSIHASSCFSILPVDMYTEATYKNINSRISFRIHEAQNLFQNIIVLIPQQLAN